MRNKVRGPNGGARPGAGRPPGAKNKATIERQKLAELGLRELHHTGRMPLQVMLARMNGDASISDDMFAAAVAAAPYIHPRLASSDTRIESNNVHVVLSDKPLTVDEWCAQYAPHANDAVALEPLVTEAEAGDSLVTSRH
jgi:hypothetical protein